MQESSASLARQIEFYQRKYELSPHSRAFAPLADLYRKAGRLDEAIEVLAGGLSEHPRYVSALVILARCHLDAGRAVEAGSAFGRVLELDPDNLVALKQLAELAEVAGDRQQAAAFLERVIVLDPTDEQATERLEDLRRPGGAAAAEEQAGASDASRAGPKGAVETAGAMAHAPGAGTGTAAMGGQAPAGPDAQRGERQSFATRTLAEVYLAQGYRDKAVAVLRQILARHPERSDVAAKIAEIENLPAESIASLSSAEPAAVPTAPGVGPPSREHFDAWLKRITKPEERS